MAAIAKVYADNPDGWWAHPLDPSTHKRHYFIDGVSLCGKWTSEGPNPMERGRPKCSECRMKAPQ